MAFPLMAVALTVQGLGQAMGAVAGRNAAARNRRFANQQADDVLRIAEDDVLQYRRQLNQTLGSLQVSGAAQGIDTTQGTQAALAEQTERLGTEDEARIRENARRQAWGIRTGARLEQQAANNQAFGQMLGAGGTLLTAGNAWRNFAGGRNLPDNL